MTDEKPDLTTTEVRQGNRRKMNLRVLVIGLVAVVIGFIAVYWYNTAVTPDTTTGIDAGETLEDAPVTEGPAEPTLEEAPQPMPAT